MEKTINFEDEEIEYTISFKKIYYKYKDIESSAVETLQPEIHNKIISIIKEADKDYHKIKKEKEEKEKVNKLIQMNKEQEDFLEEVRNLEIVKDSGFTIKKNIINNIHDSIKTFSFEEDLGYNNVNYEPSVSNNLNIYKRNKVWILNFNYKGIRYIKLESAIFKYIEKINCSINEKLKEKIFKEKLAIKEINIKNFCIKNDLKYNKECSSYRYNNHLYKGIKDNIKFELSYNEETKIISIISIYISKPTKDEILNISNISFV